MRHLPLFVFLDKSKAMLWHRLFANTDPGGGLFCGTDPVRPSSPHSNICIRFQQGQSWLARVLSWPASIGTQMLFYAPFMIGVGNLT